MDSFESSEVAQAFTIRHATSPDDLRAVGEMIRVLMVQEYHIDPESDFLNQQTLPGDYVEPDGVLLIGLEGDKPVGCIALRRLDDGVCEMKRFYMRSEVRGRGYGRLMAEELLAVAVEKGYRAMRLFTVERLASAVALYENLGFRRIPDYLDDLPPEPDIVSMEKELWNAG